MNEENIQRVRKNVENLEEELAKNVQEVQKEFTELKTLVKQRIQDLSSTKERVVRIESPKIPTGMVTIPIEATETDVAYILEIAKNAEELRKRERSIIEALRILADWHLISYEHYFETPYPTADEFRQKAQRLSINALEQELTKWKTIVEKSETFEVFIMGKLRDELKDQPIHTESFETMKFEGDKTDKKVAWFLQNYQEACRLLIMNPLFLRDIPMQVSQVKDAIPFLKEIFNTLQDVLNQKLKTAETQKLEAQKVIDEIHKVVNEAKKNVEEVQRIASEFNKNLKQKLARKIKELNEKHEALKTYYEELCEKVNLLHNELCIPAFPAIPVGLYSQPDFKLALAGYWG